VFSKAVTVRRYRQRRRAESAAATRRRIVEATIELHDEQGISGTSVRDVAGRAGVSPATVLNHFPEMGQLIHACGELSAQLMPMPTTFVLAGARDRRERVHRAAAALFAWYERMARGWNHLQIDRERIPEVDRWLRDVDASHRRLVAEAIGRAAGSPAVAIGVALTSFGSWRSLHDAGMDPARAATHVAQFIDGSLDEPAPSASKGRTH
jgi:AcrR family transcriptional regulator